MGIAVHADLMAAAAHLGRQLGVGGGHAPEHEERRPPAQVVEGVEERRRRGRVGPVVEGQRHMPGGADAGQGGQPADAGPAGAGRGRQQLRQGPERHRPGDAGGDGRGWVHSSQL